MDEFSVSSRRSLAVALLVAGALFMENLDGTIIATGLPAMGRSLHAAPVDLNVGITAYLLTLAIFIPISGWMADRFGAKTIFASAIAVFTLASIWCGMARSLGEFTLARVVQGIGGSMMVPVGRLMVVRVTPKERMMAAIAYTVWPALVAPILGPVLGGWIVTYTSWRWMFLLNVPVGVVLLILTLLIVDDGGERSVMSFDTLGFVLVGVSCFGLMYSMEMIGHDPLPLRSIAVWLTGAVVAGVVAVVHLQRTTRPLFDLSVLKIETFRVVLEGGSLFRMAIFATPFLLPLMFQVGFGMSALRSGWLTMAVFAGNLSMKTVTTPLLRRYGFRQVLLVNGSATAMILFACAWLKVGTAIWAVMLLLFLSGLGRSMQLTALTTLGYADLPPTQMSSGSTLASMVTQLNTGLGVAIAAVTLRLSSWFHGRPGGQPVGQDFSVAFAVLGALAVMSLVMTMPLRPNAGSVVSGNVVEEPATE